MRTNKQPDPVNAAAEARRQNKRWKPFGDGRVQKGTRERAVMWGCIGSVVATSARRNPVTLPKVSILEREDLP